MLFEYICWNLYIGILWWMHNRSNSMQYVSNSMQYVSNSMQYIFKLYKPLCIWYFIRVGGGVPPLSTNKQHCQYE